MFEWFGRKVLDAISYIWDIWTMTAQSLWELLHAAGPGRHASRQIVARQVLFTGVDAFPVISGIATMIGLIVITQAGSQLPKLGAGDMLGSIIVVVVIRELGPLLTAFIVVGRSGTAITTELGNMRVGQEITALELMGIRVARYLIMPRMVGMIVAMLCLTLYFDAVAVFGGFVVARIELTVPFASFGQAVARALSITDIVVTMLKGTMFGIAIASICCHHGLAVQASYTEVPQQTTKAMINSVVVCLSLDLAVTLGVYLL
jgi:phospholipid/cholesterol/gamma-HCH transport system permease protein